MDRPGKTDIPWPPTQLRLPRAYALGKKLKTRLILVRSALDLIGEKGYEATTVDDIVERAEFSRSTFFRYFATKEEVILGPRERLEGHLAGTLGGVVIPRPDAWTVTRETLDQAHA